MNIEQLKSGSYRIRQMYKGKLYLVTVPYKPTQKEALKLIADKMEEEPPIKADKTPTFDYYCTKFIESKEKHCSPATIRSYLTMQKGLSDGFKSMRLFDITSADVQRELDLYGNNRQPKSVKNMYSLIHSVFALYRPSYKLIVNLPTIIKKAEYEPSTDDIKRIRQAIKGTRYEAVIELCILGLRRGEAVAVTKDDIDDKNVLSISKDIVQDKNEKYVIKNRPKTEDSIRRIPISNELAELIRAQGKAYDGDIHEVNVQLHRVQRALNIPEFRLHMLRHFCAAYLHKQHFTDEQIMAWMGYSSPDIMRSVYRYNLDPHESMKEIKNTFDLL